MPLRDHFRSPLKDVRSWGGVHAMWPSEIVRLLHKILPEPYYAEPGVHLGTLFEVDIGTYRERSPHDESRVQSTEETVGGSLAVATYAPPNPTLTLEPQLPQQDVYEVRIYDSQREGRLVAAIEIVSPSNKDRPEHRGAFVAKAAELLKNGVCVSIVDLVGTSHFNLYAELLGFLDSRDPALGDVPPAMSGVTIRTRFEDHRRLLDSWFYPLEIGQSLPTLPVWLSESVAVQLDLETSYEEACRMLRLP